MKDNGVFFSKLAKTIELFKNKIFQRQRLAVFGAFTAKLLSSVDKEHGKILKSSYQEFFTITLGYNNRLSGID